MIKNKIKVIKIKNKLYNIKNSFKKKKNQKNLYIFFFSYKIFSKSFLFLIKIFFIYKIIINL